MKLVIYRADGPPLEVEAERFDLMCGQDHFGVRQQLGHGGESALLIRLETHAGILSTDLAVVVFPNGGNSIRLKGGLR